MTTMKRMGLIGILFALVFIGCSDETPNEQEVKKGQTIRVKMARNGGFAAVLSIQ